MKRISPSVHTVEYPDECPLAGRQLPVEDSVSILIPGRARFRVWLESQGVIHDAVGSDDCVSSRLGLERFAEGVL